MGHGHDAGRCNAQAEAGGLNLPVVQAFMSLLKKSRNRLLTRGSECRVLPSCDREGAVHGSLFQQTDSCLCVFSFFESAQARMPIATHSERVLRNCFDQTPRIRMLRLAEDLLCAPDLDDLALMQNRDAVAERAHR